MSTAYWTIWAVTRDEDKLSVGAECSAHTRVLCALLRGELKLLLERLELLLCFSIIHEVRNHAVQF